jgi:hypothetical protein
MDFPRRGKTVWEGDMLTGPAVLAVAVATLIVIWVFVLVFSPYFGSPPEH